MNKITKLLPPIMTLVIFVVIWELVVFVGDIPQYLVPAPSSIATTIIESLNMLINDITITLFEAICGFILGSLLAFLTAIIFAHSKLIEKSLYPFFVGLQAVPIIAVAPLLVIWFGNGLFGKVIMSAFICFFPVVVNTTVGLKNIETKALDLMHILSANRWQIFFKLRLPSSLPYLFSALKISASLSIIGAIVAEMAGAREGIGFRIVISSYRTDVEMMFAAIIFAAIAGISFFFLISFIERKMLGWSKEN